MFDFNKSAYPFFQVHVVSGELNEAGTGFAGNTAALDITHFIDTSEYNENDINLLNAVRRLQDIEINKYISRNTPFNTSWEEELPDAMPGKEIVQLVNEYMLPRLRRLIADAGTDALAFMLPKGKEFVTANIEQIDIFPEPAVTEFYVDREGADAFSCDCLVRLRGMVHGVEQNESPSPLVFLYNHQLFLFNNSETISLIEKFLPGGKMIIPASEWAATLHEFILPLAKEHKVDFDASMLHVMKNIVPEARLLLIEKGEHLVFKPQFSYKGYETDLLGKEVFLIPEGDKIMAIHRNKEKEQAFVARLKNLHSNLIMNEENGTLSLKGTEILKDNWFFLFVDAMKEMQVPVFGYDALRNFRFNTAKPQTKIFISSNTDWFDAKVDILFGDQQVSIAEVKRALANKQMYVQLNDGTLGVLPEEWLKKYSLLFRVGEGANQNLKLSKYHKSVVDELFELKNEEELVFELEEKYNRLRDFEKIHEIDPPEHLQTVLRPYQMAGFQWINYLRNVNWGGILADDMGLGKTVQALSYLEHYKQEHPDAKILVICPTTLIYNWENEIKNSRLPYPTGSTTAPPVPGIPKI